MYALSTGMNAITLSEPECHFNNLNPFSIYLWGIMRSLYICRAFLFCRWRHVCQASATWNGCMLKVVHQGEYREWSL